MMTIALQVVKEKLRGKASLWVMGVGMILMVIVSSGDSLSINGIKITTFEQRIPVAMAINTFLGSLVALMTSIQTIPLVIERKTSHLILSRGFNRRLYTFSLALGNVIASFIMMLLINTTLLILVLMFEEWTNLFSILLSIAIVSINVACLSAIMSVLSLFVPTFLSSIVGVILYFIGVFHGPLLAFVQAIQGFGSIVLSSIMNLIPNLSSVQKQASHALLELPLDPYPIFVMLLYLYLALAATLIGMRKDA